MKGVVRALPLVLLLAGCGSPPTRFLALSPVAPTTRAQHPACTRKLTVTRVLIPAMLDRESVVRAKAPGEIEISGTDRWAAPLDQMIQRVLADDLRDRLLPGSVLMPGDPVPHSGAAGLALNVLSFMPGPDATAGLTADWTLLDPRGKPLATHSGTVSSPAADAGQDAAAAMSAALGALADRIVATPDLC